MLERKSVILVVDDNLRNLKLLGSLLKEWGFRSILASSATDSYTYLEREQPDLILMDVLMPRIDGYTACQTIRTMKFCEKIPILFITALSDKENIVKGFEAGGVDYITKPFIQEEVRARIGVHLKLKQSLDRLERLAVTDEMTGVFNRRHAYTILKREIKNSRRFNQGFIVSYVDVDDLKPINDQFGHDAGDQLITLVVQAIQAGIRETDYLFRMGGDEFVLVLPNTGLHDARNLLERLHAAAGEKRVCDRPVDFSFGFAVFAPNAILSPDDLLRLADADMYKVKQAKRELPDP